MESIWCPCTVLFQKALIFCTTRKRKISKKAHLTLERSLLILKKLGTGKTPLLNVAY
jgi:hypothetical protein